MEMEKKLLLEKIYGLYVDNEIDADWWEDSCRSKNEYNRFNEFLKSWKWIRLEVSGGSEHSMGSVGMESIIGFINEIEWFDDIVSDFGGDYRGTARYECRDWLFELLDNEVEDEEFRNKIKDEYNSYFKGSFYDNE